MHTTEKTRCRTLHDGKLLRVGGRQARTACTVPAGLLCSEAHSGHNVSTPDVVCWSQCLNKRRCWIKRSCGSCRRQAARGQVTN